MHFEPLDEQKPKPEITPGSCVFIPLEIYFWFVLFLWGFCLGVVVVWYILFIWFRHFSLNIYFLKMIFHVWLASSLNLKMRLTWAMTLTLSTLWSWCQKLFSTSLPSRIACSVSSLPRPPHVLQDAHLYQCLPVTLQSWMTFFSHH